MNPPPRRPVLSEVINLLEVALTSINAKRGFDFEKPPQSTPTTMIEYTAVGADRPDNIVEVVVTFALRGDPLPGSDEPWMLFEGTYKLLYSRRPDYIPTSKEIEEFAVNNAVFNAWPFWRELTYGLFGRMLISMPPLPVFRMGTGVRSGTDQPSVAPAIAAPKKRQKRSR